MLYILVCSLNQIMYHTVLLNVVGDHEQGIPHFTGHIIRNLVSSGQDQKNQNRGTDCNSLPTKQIQIIPFFFVCFFP